MPNGIKTYITICNKKGNKNKKYESFIIVFV